MLQSHPIFLFVSPKNPRFILSHLHYLQLQNVTLPLLQFMLRPILLFQISLQDLSGRSLIFTFPVQEINLDSVYFHIPGASACFTKTVIYFKTHLQSPLPRF